MKNFLKFLKSKTFLYQLLFAFIGFILFIFLVLAWLKSYTNHGEFVEVPNFSKMSKAEVSKKATELGLRFQFDTISFNPNYPRFSVIDQDPKAGTKVKENRKIYCTINPAGFEDVALPKIEQVTLRNATARLLAVGLKVDRVTYIDELGKDMVYYVKYKGKNISAGARIPKTSKVELVCGNGTIPGSAIIKSESVEDNE